VAGSSQRAVVSAIFGNALVTVAKFAAFFVTGSGAMLSEGIHTSADLLNQILLLVGIRRSDRKPDREFNYGYGAERYVWALMSAVGIFFLGCGVTIYHGVDSLLHPHELSDLKWAVGVLIVSFLIEFYVLLVAVRTVRKEAGTRPFFYYLRHEADPSIAAVVLEDTAACLGVLIALGSITLQQRTGQLFWDGVGSLTIGILLGFVAVFLIVRNRSLLVGTAIPAADRDKIMTVLKDSPAIQRVSDLRTRVLDNETYRVRAEIEFNGRNIAHRLEPQLRDAYKRIHDYDDFRQFAVDYADDVVEELGDVIDGLEAQIRREVPKARHLDLEAD
jgi:zinc transporter 9